MHYYRLNIINGKNINYTVPQRFSLEGIEEKFIIFLRVNNVYKDKMLVVKSKDKIIASFKKKHLAPSEMEKVILPKKLLENVDEDLIISLEEDEAND